MTVSALTLISGFQLPSSVAPLFQATAPTQITSAVFTNVSGSSVNITVYIVRAGGAPGPSLILISAQAVTAGQAYIAKELAGKNLGNGDSLWAFAGTANVVNCSIDGFTVT